MLLGRPRKTWQTLWVAACLASWAGLTQAQEKLPRFPDFGYLPSPEEYLGKLFKLSQDYPMRKPPRNALPDFLKIDVTNDWQGYVKGAWQYASEGNIEVDWRVEHNHIRNWYHVPWQHYGPTGREGIHGLTKEAGIAPYSLDPNQYNGSYHVHAVGLYNEFGGYTIGQFWKDADNPNPKVTDRRYDGGFPEGTVVVKLLFTDAPVDQVPHLKGSLEWQAYIVEGTGERSTETVRLIQVDLMVRDARIDETGGWVFASMAYNGDLGNSNAYENLVPVGAMWGDDPDVKSGGLNPAPTSTRTNPDLRQTVINSSSTLPPQHLGWGMRLCGPVDNVASSCYSCHATAQYPALSPISAMFSHSSNGPIQIGSDKWMRWFRNLGAGMPFDEAAISCDFSLQLAKSIQNFWEWKTLEIGGFWDEEYESGTQRHPIRRLNR